MATLTQKIATIRSAFNVSTVPFAAQVAAWFSAHPGIIVQSVGYKRPDSTYTADDEVLRVAYLEATGDALGGTWESTLYQTVGTTTAQDAFNAAYETPGAVPIVPIFLLDITDHERSRTGPESLLVIGIRTDVGPLGEVGYDRAVYIASPLADIGVGSVGNALLLDASGATVSLSIPITNVGNDVWVQDQRNYVVYDELEGVYIGIPTCCGASVWTPPAATTTTAFPCPASFAEANPTTTFPPTTTTTTAPPPVVHEIFLTDVDLATWEVPADWNSANNSIEVIGGGGGPVKGGGGAYSKALNVSLTPLDIIDIQVGDGGAAAGDGEDTSFGSPAMVLAKGGSSAGGDASAGVGDVKYSGGNPGSGSGGGAGTGFAGGGGAAGPLGNGANGGNIIGGLAGSGGGGNGGGSDGADDDGQYVGGNGGNNAGSAGGGAGGTITEPGDPGTAGGGGGGAGYGSTGGLGGNGTEWDGTHGSGGGGGGGGWYAGDPGASGGLYGGGASISAIGAGSATRGGQGIIRIVYTT